MPEKENDIAESLLSSVKEMSKTDTMADKFIASLNNMTSQERSQMNGLLEEIAPIVTKQIQGENVPQEEINYYYKKLNIRVCSINLNCMLNELNFQKEKQIKDVEESDKNKYNYFFDDRINTIKSALDITEDYMKLLDNNYKEEK